MAIDLAKTIAALRQEVQSIAVAIATLEELSCSQPQVAQRRGRNKRGRKSMGAQERLEVAERMKKYWARRRQWLCPWDLSARRGFAVRIRQRSP